MPRKTSSVEVPEDLWQYFQELSGQKRPGGPIRTALYEYQRNHPLSNGGHVPQMAPPSAARSTLHEALAVTAQQKVLFHDDSEFRDRWKALGCAKRLLDDFNDARDWYVDLFMSEEAAVYELEERHALEGLNNPRGWIYRKWMDRNK